MRHNKLLAQRFTFRDELPFFGNYFQLRIDTHLIKEHVPRFNGVAVVFGKKTVFGNNAALSIVHYWLVEIISLD